MRLLQACFAVILCALGAMSLAGCASSPTQPQSMLNPEADFGSYKTFGWETDESTNASGQPVSIVDSNIRAAITAEMTRKGYAVAPAGTTPDLRVAYETAKAEKVKSSPFRIGVGVGSYGSSGGAGVGVSSSGVQNVLEGTLVVHVIDPARKAEVWWGRATHELGKKGADPAVVQGAVADALRGLPARSAPP
jgi:hypothetical protein